jgi:hypothetical protein
MSSLISDPNCKELLFYLNKTERVQIFENKVNVILMSSLISDPLKGIAFLYFNETHIL